MLLALTAPAFALSLSLQWEDTPHPGVTLQSWRASSPSADVWVARVDLCARGVSVEATEPPSATATTGSTASTMGWQLASNGDFYTSGPRVYGDAVGEWVRWPRSQTGLNQDEEWYHGRYGWIAFLHDGVTFTHTKEVKRTLGPSTGWAPEEVMPDPPEGTVALVSGFPELVIDGAPVRCTSPTASDCFPDRSDMRDRHPRTAMGLTEDMQTFLLVVVDGRTSRNAGMYGAELADLMHQLGAHVAFNLDGGGSSQLWSEGEGYLNDVSGNNSGGGTRAVTNHWGVRADGRGRPGHCAVEPPCALIPAAGGVVDDDSPCFQQAGDPVYWREEAAGHGGRLFWTNAWDNLPENQSWWRLELAEAGEYEVEVYVDPDWGVYEAARYELVAGGRRSELRLDQGAASGWASLGRHAFDAGGGQWVRVFDDSDGAVASNQRVVSDAVRLTRVGPWCGDGDCAADELCACEADCPPGDELAATGLDEDCDGAVDEAAAPGPGDSGWGDSAPSDSAGGPGQRHLRSALGCGAAPGPGGAAGLLLALLALRRRR